MSPRRAADKQRSPESAVETIATWRARGARVGFAIGAFDLLDVDQLRRLAGARSDADRLVLVVRDDAAAGAVLGPGRPVLPAAERAGLVAALRVADLVVIAEPPAATALLAGAGSADSTWCDVDLARGAAAGDSEASRDAVARVRARHADG